jgi:hypothetical protein
MKRKIGIGLLVVAGLFAGYFLIFVDAERFDVSALEQAVSAFDSEAKPVVFMQNPFAFSDSEGADGEIEYWRNLTDAMVENSRTCTEGEEAIRSVYLANKTIQFPSMISLSGERRVPADTLSSKMRDEYEQVRRAREAANKLLGAIKEFRDECPVESRVLNEALAYIFSPVSPLPSTRQTGEKDHA